MENLDINKFNPTVAELTALAEKYKGIEIKGIEDKEGLARCKEARIDLRNKRVSLEKIGKELRADAITFQKAVIEKERELIGIIEPLEKELKAKEEEIEKQKETERRKESLPQRKEMLTELGIEKDDEFLLSYSDDEFKEFFLELKDKVIEEKERKMKEEQEERERKLKEKEEKIQKEQEKVEAEKREFERQKELEQAKKEAEKKSRIETEERLKREAEEKAKKEQEEKERAEKEAKEAQEKAEREKQEAEERRAKEEKYQTFIASIKRNPAEDIKIEKDGVIKFYKFVGSYPLT